MRRVLLLRSPLVARRSLAPSLALRGSARGLCTDAPLNPQDHLTGSLLMIKEEADSFLELEDFPEVLKPPILELDNTIASYKEMKASNPEYFNKFEEALFKLSEEERAEDPRLVALKEKNEAFEDPNDVAYQAMESQYDTEYVMEKLTAAGLNEYPLSAADKADYAAKLGEELAAKGIDPNTVKITVPDSVKLF